MRRQIEKRVHIAKILKLIFGVLLVGCIISAGLSFLFGDSDVSIGLFCIFSIVAFIVGGIYFTTFRLTENAYKLMNICGVLDSTEEIDVHNYTFVKSKIICADEFFFYKKNAIAIPYYMVSWVYIRREKSFGVVTNEELIVCCKTGDSFALTVNKADIEKFVMLLTVKSERIIVGYNSRNEQMHSQNVREYRKK